jgi:hypothetical protein
MQVNFSPRADAVLQLEPSNRKTLVGRLREVTAADVQNADIKKFRQVWTECGGPSSPSARLLTEPNGNAKANKSKRPEYILHLAPERTAGVGNVCQYSTRGCRGVCLFYSGRASVWAKINAGRIAKTRAAFEYPAGFLAMLRAELFALSAAGVGSRELRPFVRLNGTSDVDWIQLDGIRHAIQSNNKRGFYLQKRIQRGGFYVADYTKALPEVRPSSAAYPLARSVWIDRPNANELAADLLRRGEKVSLVIGSPELVPAFTDTYAPRGVIVDAAKTDEWLLDDRARLGLLTPKHPATRADGFSDWAIRWIIREGGLAS